jgi:hypothetical protein
MKCIYCDGLGTFIDRSGKEVECEFCDGSGELPDEIIDGEMED